MRKSIRSRLTIAFIGLAIGPLALVGVFLAWQGFASLRQEAVRLQQEVAKRISVEVSSFVNSLANNLRVVVDIHELRVLTSQEQCDLLGVLQARQKAFSELTLLDSDGRERVRLSRLKTITTNDLCDRSKRREFLIPQKEGRIYYSPVWLDATTGEPFMTIAVPLKDLQKGQVDGVLVADVLVKRIWDLVAGLTTGPGDDMYIVDTQGRVIAHRNPSVVLRDTYFELPEKQGFHSGLNGTSVVMAMDRIRLGDQVFVIVAEREADQALGLAIRTVWIIMSLLLVVLVFACGVGILTVRKIVYPIQSLTEVARAIQAGELSKEAHVESDDEIGELATAFNSMIRQLRQSLKTLQTEVAERKRVEEALQKAHDELEIRVEERTVELQAINRELEAFSYSVSHDLRAPLRGIDGFSQVLLEDYVDALDEKAKHYLQRVRAGTQNMGRLIDDLLNLSRIGRQPMEKKTVNLETIAREAYKTLEDEWKERKVNLTLHHCPSALADPNLMQIVFVNLFSNALKFTRNRATAEIELGCETTDEQTVFHVRDNGVGFDMKYADKLFISFHRLHRAEEYEGTGVGLSIVQRIIQRHGGRIWVESEVDVGTTFWFTLGVRPGLARSHELHSIKSIR